MDINASWPRIYVHGRRVLYTRERVQVRVCARAIRRRCGNTAGLSRRKLIVDESTALTFLSFIDGDGGENSVFGISIWTDQRSRPGRGENRQRDTRKPRCLNVAELVDGLAGNPRLRLASQGDHRDKSWRGYRSKAVWSAESKDGTFLFKSEGNSPGSRRVRGRRR